MKHLRFLAFWICVQCLIVSCFLPSALWAGDPVIIGATLLQERFLTCVTQLSADDLRDTPNSDERLTVVILEHQKFLEMRDAFHAHKTGSVAQFVGKRAVENAAPRKSPKAGLSHCAWKSRNRSGISTFSTAPATTGDSDSTPARKKRRRIAELQPADLVFCL